MSVLLLGTWDEAAILESFGPGKLTGRFSGGEGSGDDGGGLEWLETRI